MERKVDQPRPRRQVQLVETHLVNVLLEISHTALTAVVADQGLDSSRVKLDVGITQTVGLLGLGSEVSIGNGKLLIGDIAADFQDFHPVEQGCRNRLESVGCKANMSKG